MRSRDVVEHRFERGAVLKDESNDGDQLGVDELLGSEQFVGRSEHTVKDARHVFGEERTCPCTCCEWW